jgi:hypothetical protein
MQPQSDSLAPLRSFVAKNVAIGQQFRSDQNAGTIAFNDLLLASKV